MPTPNTVALALTEHERVVLLLALETRAEVLREGAASIAATDNNREALLRWFQQADECRTLIDKITKQ